MRIVGVVSFANYEEVLKKCDQKLSRKKSINGRKENEKVRATSIQIRQLQTLCERLNNFRLYSSLT